MDFGSDSQATQLEAPPMNNASPNDMDAFMSMIDSTFQRYVYACALMIFPSSPTHAAYVRFSADEMDNIHMRIQGRLFYRAHLPGPRPK